MRVERTFKRFTIGQRWEHALLIVCVAGAAAHRPAPEISRRRMEPVAPLHPGAGGPDPANPPHRRVLLTAGSALSPRASFILIARRRLPGDMLPNWQDVRDAWQMITLPALLNPQETGLRQIQLRAEIYLLVPVLWHRHPGDLRFHSMVSRDGYARFLPGGVVPAALSGA